LFNQKNDNETDFCESYKSQVLGTEEQKRQKLLFGTIVKLLTILILLVIIIGVSFYGYHYFNKNESIRKMLLPPVSTQTVEEDKVEDDLVVTQEEPKKNIDVETSVSIKRKDLDIDKIANEIKIEIAKSEREEGKKVNNNSSIVITDKKIILNKEESLAIPTSPSPEAQYLEELAKLSKEIDRDRNK